MPQFKVNVKWGKEKFEKVEVDTDETPEVFKAQLFALSGVSPDRQKVMLKGAVLKDDGWGNMKLKDGITLLMMGTAGEIPQAPTEKTVFMEDMSDAQLASAFELPAGLNNLGNTCYMNATVQCFRNVPELKEALYRFDGSLGFGGGLESAQSITVALRDLYKSMDKPIDSLPPIIFLQVLHMAFPQFAEKNEHGVFHQQDANECWTQVMRMLQQKIPGVKPADTDGQGGASTAATTDVGKKFIDQYFGIESQAIMKCTEAPEEAESKSVETLYQLSCFISQEVKYMHTGLRSRLEESITKHSPTLDRDAVYKKTTRLNRLPAYLTIQFVRFYYKEKESVNAKILKDVKFPLNLDVFDLCTDELQQKLMPVRGKFKELEDKKMEEAEKLKEEKPGKTNGAASIRSAPQAMDVDKKTTLAPYSFEDDVGSNNSGYYELIAILTHQGRSSSSGHYVAWIRKKDDHWMKCDDDNISVVKNEDVLKLSGGGDWHCAYLLLYGPRRLEVVED